MIKLYIICLIGFVFIFSCKTEKQRKMEEAAEKMEKAAEEMAEAAEELGEHFAEVFGEAFEENADELADKIENLQESLEFQANVEVIAHMKLKKRLPESFAGLERKKERSQKDKAMGLEMSTAEALYFNDSGKKEIKLQIADMGSMAAFLRLGAAAWYLKDIDEETDSGFERTTEINGYKAFEEYDRQDRRGKISVIADKRFLIQARCRNMSFGDLKDAMEDFDYEGLFDLADADMIN